MDLSYDPHDPWFAVPGRPGLRFAVQVFTMANVYGIDLAHTEWTPIGARRLSRLTADGLSWAGQQQRSPGEVEVLVDHRDDGSLSWRIAVSHAEPVKAVKLAIRGLPAEALAAGWWQASTEPGRSTTVRPGRPLLWRYPWPAEGEHPEWETPWAACGGNGPEAPVACLSVRDRQVRAVRLYVHRPPWADDDPVVELVLEDDARRWQPGRRFDAPEIRLSLGEGPAAAEEDFAAHLVWLEGAYGLQPWEARRDVPRWLDDVAVVLNLHGQHWTGYVFNTFDAMAEVLRFAADQVPAGRLLAYLAGWEGRYYHAYPWYAPGEALGGAAGFERLAAVAGELGVRLMPMFGVHGMNAAGYHDWERSALRARTGRGPALVNRPDWDGDRASEDDQLFANPGEPVFREHLTGQIDALVTRFGLEAVFLDTTACWFNDPRHNVVDGYRTLLADLRDRHRGLLVAGEGYFDALLALFPLHQSWSGVHRATRFPGLPTRYARAFGHLSTPALGMGSTGVHERGWARAPQGAELPLAGHLPALAFVDDTLRLHREECAVLLQAWAGVRPTT